MNAIDLLKTDHDVVDELFKQVEDTPPSKHAPLFKKIKNELDTHAHIEEKIFYPTLISKGDKALADITKEGLEEHAQMKKFLKEISGSTSTDKREAKMKVLIEDTRHHVQEEENEMFPMVESQFSSEELDKLGERLEAEKMKFQKAKKIPARREQPQGAVGGIFQQAKEFVAAAFAGGDSGGQGSKGGGGRKSSGSQKSSSAGKSSSAQRGAAKKSSGGAKSSSGSGSKAKSSGSNGAKSSGSNGKQASSGSSRSSSSGSKASSGSSSKGSAAKKTSSAGGSKSANGGSKSSKGRAKTSSSAKSPSSNGGRRTSSAKRTSSANGGSKSSSAKKSSGSSASRKSSGGSGTSARSGSGRGSSAGKSKG
jgi:hemerythrin-like domain-containing protein